jgi:hypothetical protein
MELLAGCISSLDRLWRPREYFVASHEMTDCGASFEKQDKEFRMYIFSVSGESRNMIGGHWAHKDSFRRADRGRCGPQECANLNMYGGI